MRFVFDMLKSSGDENLGKCGKQKNCYHGNSGNETDDRPNSIDVFLFSQHMRIILNSF